MGSKAQGRSQVVRFLARISLIRMRIVAIATVTFSQTPASSQANERRKIAVQIDQPVEVDHYPHQNHDNPRSDFDLA